jgi:hypothetical protein
MTAITVFTWLGASFSYADRKLHEFTVDVKFRKGTGRYNIDLANGETVGWVCRNDYTRGDVAKGTWNAYIGHDAYFPPGTDLMTKIRADKDYRHVADSALTGEKIVVGARSRGEAVAELLHVLFDRRAESVDHIVTAVLDTETTEVTA